MLNLKTTVVSSATAIMLALGSPVAFAQGGGAGGAEGQYGTQPPPAQQQDISDSQLAVYAQAAQKVAELQQGIQQEMQAAENAEEAQSIQAAGQERMIQAVESFGLTVDEYNRIATAIQSDPELRSKLEQLIQQSSQ